MSHCDEDKKSGGGGCRTINLSWREQPKPNMQIYDKCIPLPDVSVPMKKLPFQAMRPKVCRKVLILPAPKIPLLIKGGKLVNAIKIGVLAGTVYFTVSQGVWGDQQDVGACIIRWKNYIRSINSRHPFKYDACGNLVLDELGKESLVGPLYAMYKGLVYSSFSTVVKLPGEIKCAYLKFEEMMAKKNAGKC